MHSVHADDTHRLIKDLRERGFSERQATGIVEAIEGIDLSQQATKQDIKDLGTKLRELELRMTIKLGAMIAAGVGLLGILKFFTA